MEIKTVVFAIRLTGRHKALPLQIISTVLIETLNQFFAIFASLQETIVKQGFPKQAQRRKG
jgi:hypothetical protein